MTIQFSKETNAFIYGEEIPEGCNNHYANAFLRYLNIFYKVFNASFDKCEFSSLMALFAVRGVEGPGWDPYKSSIDIINSIVDINDKINNPVTQHNLHLWLYGHILEASEPYEKIMNMIDIITGEQYLIEKFPSNNKGNQQTPGQKIKKISEKAKIIGLAEVEGIYAEIWDRELRNAIFHSDYALYNGEVRIRKPDKIYSSDKIDMLVNYTLAYFQVINTLHNMFISRYEKPTIIEPHTDFKNFPFEKAVVIVREGHGAVGIKDNWTLDQIKRGAIPYRLGRFYPDEVDLLNKNPTLALLPPRSFKQ